MAASAPRGHHACQRRRSPTTCRACSKMECPITAVVSGTLNAVILPDCLRPCLLLCSVQCCARCHEDVIAIHRRCHRLRIGLMPDAHLLVQARSTPGAHILVQTCLLALLISWLGVKSQLHTGDHSIFSSLPVALRVGTFLLLCSLTRSCSNKSCFTGFASCTSGPSLLRLCVSYACCMGAGSRVLLYFMGLCLSTRSCSNASCRTGHASCTSCPSII